MNASEIIVRFEANKLRGAHPENASLLAEELGSSKQRTEASEILQWRDMLLDCSDPDPELLEEALEEVHAMAKKLIKALEPAYRRTAAGITIKYAEVENTLNRMAIIRSTECKTIYISHNIGPLQVISEEVALVQLVSMIDCQNPPKPLWNAAAEVADALLATMDPQKSEKPKCARHQTWLQPSFEPGTFRHVSASIFDEFCSVIEGASDDTKVVIIESFWGRLGNVKSMHAAMEDVASAKSRNSHSAGVAMDHALAAGYSGEAIIYAALYASRRYRLRFRTHV